MESLTPTQDRVLALISAGFSATEAARQAGVHRHTVANWLQSEDFCTALALARAEKQMLYCDQAEALAAEALQNLTALMRDPTALPSVRLRAAIAVLEHSRKLLPSLVLPEPDEPPPAPGEPKNKTMSKNVQPEAPPSQPAPQVEA